MKQQLLFSIFLFALSANLSAQNLFLGVKPGLNWTNIRSNLAGNYITGFTGGVNLEYLYKENASVEVDFLFEQRGYSVNTFFTDSNGVIVGNAVPLAENYKYLSLPIKRGFYFEKTIAGFVKLGLVPAFLLNARTEVAQTDANGNFTGTQVISITTNVKRFDLAGMIEGGGIYYLKDQLGLLLSLSYQHSFTRMPRHTNFEKRHYGFCLSAGVRIPLK